MKWVYLVVFLNAMSAKDGISEAVMATPCHPSIRINGLTCYAFLRSWRCVEGHNGTVEPISTVEIFTMIVILCLQSGQFEAAGYYFRRSNLVFDWWLYGNIVLQRSSFDITGAFLRPIYRFQSRLRVHYFKMIRGTRSTYFYFLPLAFP